MLRKANPNVSQPLNLIFFKPLNLLSSNEPVEGIMAAIAVHSELKITNNVSIENALARTIWLKVQQVF